MHQLGFVCTIMEFLNKNILSMFDVTLKPENLATGHWAHMHTQTQTQIKTYSTTN